MGLYSVAVVAAAAGRLLDAATQSRVAVRRAAATAGADRRSGAAGREFVNRERHAIERVAGTAGVGLYALLVGYAELDRVDEILLGALEADDREESERNREIFLTAVDDVAAEHTANLLGDLVAAAATMALALRGFDDARAENYGVDRLDNSYRQICAHLTGAGGRAEAVGRRGRTEYTDFAVSAVEYDRLLGDSETTEGLRLAGANAGFKLELDIEADGDTIEAAAQLYRLDAYRRRADLRRFASDLTGVLNQTLTHFVEIYAHILEAIAVTAAVKHLIGVDEHAARRGIAAGYTILRKIAAAVSLCPAAEAATAISFRHIDDLSPIWGLDFGRAGYSASAILLRVNRGF